MVGAGTPAYMAPELVKGLEPVPQTDIYGLGIVIYEMLSGGERPFTGDKAQITGTTSAKVRWEQINLPPPSINPINPNVPLDVENIITKCLEKKPENRFSSRASIE